MKIRFNSAVASLAVVTGVVCAYSDATSQVTLKKEVESAIVWSGAQCRKSETALGTRELMCDGVSSTHPEASSLVDDPITGETLRKLSYDGVEILAELKTYSLGCGWSSCTQAFIAGFTVVNNSDSPLQIDGNSFTSTLRQPTPKEIRKWWGKKASPVDFVPKSGSVMPGRSAKISVVMVGPGEATNTTMWFHNSFYSVIPIRFSIKFKNKDFVFPWLAPTQSAFERVPQWDY